MSSEQTFPSRDNSIEVLADDCIVAELYVSGESQHRFLTTGDPSQFQELSRRFLGPEVSGRAACRR